MATTRLLIKQDVVRVLAKKDEVLAALPVPLSATALGTTTTLIDAKLGRGTMEANRYDARLIELTDQVASVTISTSSVADPTVITTATNHGLTTGDSVVISGHTSVTPDINGEHVVIVTADTTFTIPIEVTDGGTGGTVQQLPGRVGVDDAGFNISTDTLTFSPTVAAVVAGAPYLMYPLGLGPEVLNEYLSALLRDTLALSLWFPSLVGDADFLASSTVSDNWDTVGTPSTVPEFVTGAANVFFGEKAIHTVADAATEGFESKAFDVHEGEPLLVSVFVRAAVGSVSVVLRNATASEDVSPSPVTIDELAWTEVRFNVNVPADCKQMRMRFISTAASDDFYVSPHIAVQAKRTYVLPSWFVDESQFIEACYLELGRASEDANSFVALGAAPRFEPSPDFIREDRAVNPFRVFLDPSGSRPVYFVCRRPFDDVTVNSDSTPIDREYAKARIIANILSDWPGEDRDHAVWSRRAAARGRFKGYIIRELRINPNPLVVV